MTMFPTGMSAKTTPIDTDVVLLADSADSNNPKKVTMANAKAYMMSWISSGFNAVSSTTYTSWLLTQFTWDTVVYDITYDTLKRISTITNGVNTWTAVYTNGQLTGLSKA